MLLNNFSITVLISLFSYIIHNSYYNILYLILALIADGILIADSVLILKTPTSDMGHQVKRTIKFAVFIELLASLLGLRGLILP
ncbi:MAG: hypothetical protein ACFFD2_00660 [Promethearchaeota archaeon]